MSTESWLSFEPSELNFPFELNKQLSSSIRLWNKTENHVAFKLLTTDPRKYGVRPRIGVLLPGSARDIKVTRQPLRVAPHNMKCKDKFMIQSAVANTGATMEDAQKMFNKEAGHAFQECKLRVVYCKPDSHFGPSVIDNSNHVSEVTSAVIGPHVNILEMSPRKLVDVQPPKLQVPLSSKKEVSCTLQLSNVTEHHVAFSVKTVNPRFIVQPDTGVLLPQSSCDITVKFKVESKIPSEMQSADKFLIQSRVAAAATTMEHVRDMFDEARSHSEECELQVVYISKQQRNNKLVGELMLRGILICLLGLISFYLMKKTLSLFWSLTMVAVMLMIKMIKKLVSESVEDWIVKILLNIFMYLVFGRKEGRS